MPVAVALGLTVLSLAAVRGHTRRDALSADEPIHILSGGAGRARGARPSPASAFISGGCSMFTIAVRPKTSR